MEDLILTIIIIIFGKTQTTIAIYTTNCIYWV